MPETTPGKVSSKALSPTFSTLSITDELNDTLDEDASLETPAEPLSIDEQEVQPEQPKRGKKKKGKKSMFSSYEGLGSAD